MGTKEKIKIGWVYCGIILLNFVGNLTFLSYITFKNLICYLQKKDKLTTITKKITQANIAED